jgi:tetratricopeptide (TPR) repeat protein
MLGLDTAVSQKDILRRYKEIINRIKIDDVPVYELDINLPDNFRTEEGVKEALKDLQSQKDNIREYFFWFQISNANDKKILDLISKGKFIDAIKALKELTKVENVTSFFYKKNLAVLYCILLETDDNEKYLDDSISIWNEIVKSEKFWDMFSKNYANQNEQTVSQENIVSFRNTVTKEISDVYADLGQKHKDSNYVKKFQEVFGVYGESTEKNVLQPTYKAINEIIVELQKIKIDQNDKDIERKISTMHDNIESIKALLGKLKKSGLYEQPETRVIRDHVAEAIRVKVVEIHNQAGLYEEAEKFIKIATSIAGTESYKGELESDEGKIEKSIEMDGKSVVSVVKKGIFSTKSAEFKPRYVDYEGKRIYYKDVNWITYNGVRSNYSTTYYFTVSAGETSISLSFSELQTWQNVIWLSTQLIIPIIVKRYIDSIFDEDTPITIGEVEISKQGYSRRKFFGGTDSVSWKERIFKPQLFSGNVILYKENEAGRGSIFSSIPMTTANAVVLPMLIRECVNKAFALGIIKGVGKVNVQQPKTEFDMLFEKQEEDKRKGGGEAVRKTGGEEWVSYSGAKYYIINNRKTGKWDICSTNQNNPPLEKSVWAGSFNTKEEAEKYLVETIQKTKAGF